tara:strand:- start:503 stop:685 length:183 start_codon:yes stop_codon:yes gene_type:complete
MTPFERAEENVNHFAKMLTMFNLVRSTILDTEGMSKEESDVVWVTIFALLERFGVLDEVN